MRKKIAIATFTVILGFCASNASADSIGGQPVNEPGGIVRTPPPPPILQETILIETAHPSRGLMINMTEFWLWIFGRLSPEMEHFYDCAAAEGSKNPCKYE